MTVFEAISLMLSFGSLVVLLVTHDTGNKKK
ncbi:putative holin-like toxin [Brevibacillus ruminantium]|uniref:Holin-like toxin n=1 Tax=Brevibacillus ruminantium TaxID=2950604 RepID=A0ABY4WC19_9BACL|nr:putative holin-like toxin [Brevibacillus ruminantium]USG64449.1 putative holin-like toxin [Brevibacillus ruminantium]